MTILKSIDLKSAQSDSDLAKRKQFGILLELWCYTERAEIEARENIQARIVIGGEVDAVLDSKPLDQGAPINWVELKTTAELVSEKEQNKYERKLLKFWAQSFLLGLPKIIVGFRDQQGWLHRLEELDTQTIPDKILKSGRRLWGGQTCINFAIALLEWLKATITNEGIWRIKKSSALEVFRIEEAGTGSILSDAFLEWRTNILPNIVSAQ